jgi:serine/threonine protein kinase
MVVHITKRNNGCVDSSDKSKNSNSLDELRDSVSEHLDEPDQKKDNSSLVAAGFLERSFVAFHEKSHLNYRNIPSISRQDVKLKEKLGQGGFAAVYAAEYNGNSCAFKSLQPDVINGAIDTRNVAIADLWKEAEILSALNHPNIVFIIAKSTDVSAVENNFIVMERLGDTLDHRMQIWREQDQKVKSNLKERLRLLHDRLRVCIEICQAMQYLHEMNVLYRDLKAENLGFDMNGKIKLFGEYTAFKCIVSSLIIDFTMIVNLIFELSCGSRLI